MRSKPQTIANVSVKEYCFSKKQIQGVVEASQFKWTFKYSFNNGLGPTKLIWPKRIFIRAGISSKDVILKKAPNFVKNKQNKLIFHQNTSNTLGFGTGPLPEKKVKNAINTWGNHYFLT